MHSKHPMQPEGTLPREDQSDDTKQQTHDDVPWQNVTVSDQYEHEEAQVEKQQNAVQNEVRRAVRRSGEKDSCIRSMC
jgi:hypothetical protein